MPVIYYHSYGKAVSLLPWPRFYKWCLNKSGFISDIKNVDRRGTDKIYKSYKAAINLADWLVLDSLFQLSKVYGKFFLVSSYRQGLAARIIYKTFGTIDIWLNILRLKLGYICQHTSVALMQFNLGRSLFHRLSTQGQSELPIQGSFLLFPISMRAPDSLLSLTILRGIRAAMGRKKTKEVI